MSQVSKDITHHKDQLVELGHSITKNKAFLASNEAVIVQLKKDLAANIASQKESEGIRIKEHSAHLESKHESEQCIGALEAALRVLAGVGRGKGGFLETLQEPRLMNVVARV